MIFFHLPFNCINTHRGRQCPTIQLPSIYTSRVYGTFFCFLIHIRVCPVDGAFFSFLVHMDGCLVDGASFIILPLHHTVRTDSFRTIY